MLVAKHDDRINGDFFDFYSTNADQKGVPIFSKKTFNTSSKITILNCKDLSDVADIIDPDADLITIDRHYDIEAEEKINALIENSHGEFELAISDSPQAAWKLYGFTSGIPYGITLHSLQFIKKDPDALPEYLACHSNDMYRAWLERYTVEVKLRHDITLLIEFGDNIAYIYEQRCCCVDRKTTSPYEVTNETVCITEIINGRKTRRFYGWAIPEAMQNGVYEGVLNAWKITTYKPAD